MNSSSKFLLFILKSSGLDISWTAAYALEAGWMIKYYNDVATTKEHWTSLKAYVDGQVKNI